MKRAFTLLELLTVVSIMALLGVASSSGYQAMVRGMRERGAVAGASAVLRGAKERACVDRVPTAVFCYNRMLREAGGSEQANAVVVGEMVAIRRAGRVSAARGNYIFDEFGDFAGQQLTDEEDDLKKSGGRRLYRFGGGEMTDMRYSIVAEAGFRTDSEQIFTFTHGTTNIELCAYYNLKKSDREPSAWKAGHAYGFEFATLQLPAGFVFGSDLPTQAGKITTPKVLYFDPEEDKKPTIDVWATRAGSGGGVERFRKAGEARADDTAI